MGRELGSPCAGVGLGGREQRIHCESAQHCWALPQDPYRGLCGLDGCPGPCWHVLRSMLVRRLFDCAFHVGKRSWYRASFTACEHTWYRRSVLGSARGFTSHGAARHRRSRFTGRHDDRNRSAASTTRSEVRFSERATESTPWWALRRTSKGCAQRIAR
jgi:hypothetical protein